MPVLLTGETGTGKSALAAAIHDWSRHRGGPFVTVSSHARDTADRPRLAPRSDAADRWARLAPGGTLYIDDVAMLSRGAQSSLVRFIDSAAGSPDADGEKVVFARVLSATSRDLEHAVAGGRFSRDLYFRLNAVTIQLPPLRERRAELQELAAKILARLCMRHHRDGVRLDPRVHAVLVAYDWRGNLRELETVLEHAVVLARTNVVAPSDLPEQLLAAMGEA
jgi:DNA-binding NtrC family response regulator